MSRTRVLALGLLLPLVLAGMVAARRPAWSDAELEQIRSLWIGTLEAAPADASNRYADDVRAAAFGEQLFNDVRLSSNGAVSCATCHVAERDFQDDRALAEGVGRTDRRTMPIAGTQYSPFLFWDGRKDSQWAQALGPLESAVEHGGDRTLYAHVIAAHYRQEYESLFGPLPKLAGLPHRAGPVADSAAAAAWAALTPQQQEAVTGVFVNLGKAIAAFERRIVPAPAAFDAYVRSLVEGGDDEDALSADAVAGLRLFTGKAQCSNCHNGPLLTDDHFHNTGVAPVAGLPEDRGRARGAQQVLADEFNCRSRWSDAAPGQCSELEFMVAEGEELVRAFKTPSLRGVSRRPPYMHAGQIETLAHVIEHYDGAPAAVAGHSELKPLGLSAKEKRQLVAYLESL
jgi:cytochrome c peroxidase